MYLFSCDVEHIDNSITGSKITGKIFNIFDSSTSDPFIN